MKNIIVILSLSFLTLLPSGVLAQNNDCCLCTCKQKKKLKKLDSLFTLKSLGIKYCLIAKNKKTKCSLIRFSIDGTHQSTDNFIFIIKDKAFIIKKKNDKRTLNEIEKLLIKYKFPDKKRLKTLDKITHLINCNNNQANFGVF
tara:strand:- start:62 stop:490 length:429 start_codon:yes stop_codon:yes gene_type:complete